MKSRNIPYIPRLDHFRLLAALLVFAFHFFHYHVGAWQAHPNLFWLGPITEGHTGVSLFFVLSGFIFMTIALAGREIRYGQFMRNRVLRIVPLFLVIFMIAISIGRDRFVATDIFYVLFSNIGDPPTSWHFATGPAWSISVEFTFYLIFPFLAFFTRDQGPLYPVKLLGILLMVKLGAYFATENSTLMFYSTLIGRFDQFLIGMMGAMLYARHRSWFEKHAGLILVASLILIWVALGIQARWASYFLPDQKQPFWIAWSSLEASLWAAILIGYLAAPFRLPDWIDRAFAKGGEWSFSIYMWHTLVIFTMAELFGRFGGTGMLNLALTGSLVLAVTLAFSWLSYSAIERPFLIMRRRYTQSDGQKEQGAEDVDPALPHEQSN